VKGIITIAMDGECYYVDAYPMELGGIISRKDFSKTIYGLNNHILSQTRLPPWLVLILCLTLVPLVVMIVLLQRDTNILQRWLETESTQVYKPHGLVLVYDTYLHEVQIQLQENSINLL